MGDAAMNELGNLRMTCPAVPVQYDGDVDGYPAYFRYRFGHWYFVVTHPGSEPVMPKKEDLIFFREGDRGDEWAGDMPKDEADEFVSGLVAEFRARPSGE